MYEYLKNKTKQKERAFTLIELLVSITLFAGFITLFATSFNSGIKTQRNVLAEQELLNQTSYAMERIARAVIMAKKDVIGNCTGSIPKKNYYFNSSTKVLSFIDSNNVCRKFNLDSGALKEVNNEVSFGDLTSPKINVLNFNVSIMGDDVVSDQYQPRVTIYLEAQYEGFGIEDSPRIKLQTTVSQRNPDI